jgi:hypothetical protein
MTSPYAPPKSAVADRRPDARRGATLLAVLAGVGVDLVLTEGGLFLYGIVSGTVEVAATLVAVPFIDEIVMLVIGLGATVAGGFAAAWVANRREILHGVLFGIATLVVGELLLLLPAAVPAGDLPAWRQILWYTLAIPAAVTGAALRARRRRQDAATTGPGAAG